MTLDAMDIGSFALYGFLDGLRWNSWMEYGGFFERNVSAIAALCLKGVQISPKISLVWTLLFSLNYRWCQHQWEHWSCDILSAWLSLQLVVDLQFSEGTYNGNQQGPKGQEWRVGFLGKVCTISATNHISHTKRPYWPQWITILATENVLLFCVNNQHSKVTYETPTHRMQSHLTQTESKRKLSAYFKAIWRE